MGKSREFSVTRDSSLYTIDFKYRSEDLIRSILQTNQFPGATASDDYKSIVFTPFLLINAHSGAFSSEKSNGSMRIEDAQRCKASTVKSFAAYNKELPGGKMKYNDVLLLIDGLSRQLSYLINKCHKCFYSYALENLLVVDDSKFIYVSNEHLLLIRDEMLLLMCPFSKSNGFFSPELMNIYTIPSKINYKTIYYSFGLLVLFGLTGIELTRIEDIDIAIREVEGLGSKMFGFVKRCLAEDLDNRCLLFI